MKLSIDTQILDKYNGLQCGIVVAKTVNNERKTFALNQIFDGLCAQTGAKLKKSQLDSMPKISNWHNVYDDISGKTFKTNLETLLRDVLAKRNIDFTDNLTRIRDYFMLKWKLPIICFSLNDIYGDIILSPEGKDIVYKDRGSVLTKKWNSQQFERGSATRQTTSVAFIVEDLGIVDEAELKENLQELAGMLQKYCFGAEIETHLIKKDAPEIELGVEGMTEFIDGDKPDIQEEEGEQETPIVEEKIPEVEEVKEELDQEAHAHQDRHGDQDRHAHQDRHGVQATIEHPDEAEQTLVDASSLKARLKLMLEDAVKNTFPEIEDSVKVEYPRDHSHGDYACSIALKLAKQLGQNPLEIASKIKQNIQPLQFIDSIEVVQPGFINIKLSPEYLVNQINEIAQGKEIFDSSLGHDQTILFDYSHPNIAKPLGVHHLLSTIIGQSLYDIYKNLGFNCVAINHLGDWGTQFGKLIYAYRTWGNKKEVEKDPIPELLKLYVKFHDEAEKDESLEDKGREEFKKLEQGDEENYKLWEWFKELSIIEIKKAYEILNVSFDEYLGESFYNDKMAPLIEEGLTKGVFKKGEGGAIIAEFEDENMAPAVIQKSDGATLYLTRDIATLDYRIKKWNPAEILYVVDSAQSLHFQQLFEIGRKLERTEAKVEHVSFGRMRLPDKSMSTRKGNVVLLEELLEDGIERARKIVEEKSKDLKKKEKEKVAEMIAIGAVKYNILSQNRTTEMAFDWDRMLSVEGNSAPYLQYTYARAESILRKAEEEESGKKKLKKKASEDQIDLFQAIETAEGTTLSEGQPLENEHELEVARWIPKFQEFLVLAAQEYKPNLLAQYLYELAQAFNGFYNSVPVLKTENSILKETRLNLTRAVSRALKEGLAILGIEVPERM